MKGGYSVTDRSSCDKQTCSHNTLRRQCCITTSKEYLTNIYVLFKYFYLIFCHLQLVKILCKLVITSLNYERKNGGFLRNTMYRVRQKKSGPLKFFAVFSATVWDFNMKFYSFIHRNLLHLKCDFYAKNAI